MKTNRNWGRRSHRSGEAGQAMLFILLAMGIFLLGALCFAFDMSNMWFHRQAAQTAADAACAAGAMDILVDSQGGATTHQGFTLGTAYTCTTASTDSVCTYANKNGYNSNNAFPGNQVKVSFPTTAANGAPPGVTIPPAALAGAYPFIRVDIVDHVQTFFLGLLNGSTTKDLRAFSTCGVDLVKVPIPLVVLNTTVTKALGGNGTPTIKILGGPTQSIQVNSSSLTAVGWGGTIDLSKGGPAYNGSSLGTYGGPSTYAAGAGTFLPANSKFWMYPSSPILDPFAQVNAPAVPTPPSVPIPGLTPTNSSGCTTSASIQAGTCVVTYLTHGCPDPTATLANGNCVLYTAGYYSPTGITVKNATAIFDPGLYYLDGGLALKANSMVRPGTGTGDGSKGTIFYLTGASQTCSGQTGLVCVGSNSGKGGLDTFDIYAAQCPGGVVVDPNLIAALNADGVAYTGLTGNLLLAPCSGTYGDPSGAGQYRGMLFFGDRASSVGGGWGGGGGFLLAGSIYMHQCNAGGTGTGCGAPPADYQANFGFQGNSGSASYVLGEIVTDQLSGGGTPKIYMVLNPNSSYSTLKASIFQ